MPNKNRKTAVNTVFLEQSSKLYFYTINLCLHNTCRRNALKFKLKNISNIIYARKRILKSLVVVNKKAYLINR